jgi:hypothetical protein
MLKTLKIHDREDDLVTALVAEAPSGPLIGSPLHPAIQAVLANISPRTIDNAR